MRCLKDGSESHRAVIYPLSNDTLTAKTLKPLLAPYGITEVVDSTAADETWTEGDWRVIRIHWKID